MTNQFSTLDFFKKLYTRKGDLAKGIIYVDKEFTHAKPFPVAKLEEISKIYTGDLAINTYFTPNSFSIDESKRLSDNVISLNAFYIDIDYKKLNLDRDFVLEEVKKRAKVPFSAIVSSGNGLHLYYFIDFVYIPKRTTKTNTIINLYETTLSDLITVFSDLNADQGAKGLNRYLRIPNSRNVKEETGVQNVEILELNDNVYDLRTIAILYKKGYVDYLKSADKQAKAIENRQKQELKKAQGIKTKHVNIDLANDRVSDLIRLIELRNGCVETRNDFLRLCTFFNPSRIFEMNNSFNNPKTKVEIKSYLSYSNSTKEKKDMTLLKKTRWTNAQIINVLKITEVEQKHLKTIISKEESNLRNKLRMRLTRELPKLALKTKKDLSKYYTLKYMNTLKNNEIATDLNISLKTVFRYKKADVNIFEINKNIKEIIELSEGSKKTVSKLVNNKNIEQMSKREVLSIIKFLAKVA